MEVSMIELHREAVLKAIREAGRGQWKILVVDDASWKLLQSTVKEDDILNERITHVEQIEHRRSSNKEMDAIYVLTPEEHIVDCVMADLERKRYRQASLLWTALLPLPLRKLIDESPIAQKQIVQFQVLDIGFFARESRVVTFRDPWSFPILFHPQCNNLVRRHLEEIAQKIVSVCVLLGEYPTIRYYKPRAATHEAGVLCSHLAKFVQEQIDMYATYHSNFPPPSNRPRATLYILDRSLDLVAPLVHEFTYQAMAHDLLPIREGAKVTYKVKINEDTGAPQEKDLEISEKDKIWLANRHQHMKDTIERLMGEFQKFMDDNPHFTKADAAGSNSLNAIKDMLAGLPQFQEMKEAYSLHLSMAQESMNIFQRQKLADISSVEQSLATGLDEDYKKPKNLADQLVRMLDDDSIAPPDRLRLILLYLLYRDGLIPSDTTKLLAHAQLPSSDGQVVQNLVYLGARISRHLKDSRPLPNSLFPRKTNVPNLVEDYSLSRFEPTLKLLLEEHVKATLDQYTFPYTKPQLDSSDSVVREDASQTSLRSAKPTWARTRTTASEPRQRVIVFMAGGATYSESRSCYEICRESNKDVYLLTSHMLTPSLFLRQVGDLSIEKKLLGIPAESPKPKAPAHLFEPDQEATRQPVAAPVPPKTSSGVSAQMAKMRMSSNGTQAEASNGNALTSTRVPQVAQAAPVPSKDEEKKKKKLAFFSSKK